MRDRIALVVRVAPPRSSKLGRCGRPRFGLRDAFARFERRTNRLPGCRRSERNGFIGHRQIHHLVVRRVVSDLIDAITEAIVGD